MYFDPPETLDTEVFARVPDSLRLDPEDAEWTRMQHPGEPIGCFLEGPSFDRDGNLYCVDIPFGRIFRVSRDGEFSVVARYDGEPNGLKIHKDGRIFITDHKRGLMALDPSSGEVAPLLERPRMERFIGVNDLVFASNGDLYFTDQGQSGMQEPRGRLYRLRAADGRLDLLLSNVPSPNGLVLNAKENTVPLAVTRGNCVWRVRMFPDGSVAKTGIFIQLSGGLAGPDGLAIDEAENLAVAHAGYGTVWLFNRLGEPVYRIRSCTGLFTTNVAYGWPDRENLYITESHTGTILRARLKVPGRPMYSHA